MANLARVRVPWGGTPVTGDGVSTFYFDEAHSGFLSDVRTFFDAWKGWIAGGTTFSFPDTGDLIDVATGELTGTWAEPVAATIVATGIGQWAQGVGTRSVWRTSGIRRGRRVQGSTFMVPLTSGCFTGAGGLDDAIRALMLTASSNLVLASGTNMKIYSQPDAAGAGQQNTVIGAVIPDKVSWLRSRRT